MMIEASIDGGRFVQLHVRPQYVNLLLQKLRRLAHLTASSVRRGQRINQSLHGLSKSQSGSEGSQHFWLSTTGRGCDRSVPWSPQPFSTLWECLPPAADYLKHPLFQGAYDLQRLGNRGRMAHISAVDGVLEDKPTRNGQTSNGLQKKGSGACTGLLRGRL